MDFVWDRPLSTSEILASTFRLFREHAGLLVRVVLGPLILGLALDLASRAIPPESLAIILLLPVWMVLYGLAQARASLAAWEVLHHRSVDPDAVIAQARRHWVAIVVTYVLKWILIAAGLLLFVVPGVLMILRWFAIPLANVVEGIGVPAGFRRSRTLANGNRRQILATLVVIDLAVMVAVIGFTLAFVDSTSGQAPLWVSVALWLVSMVYVTFEATLTAVLYANARIRNEGYSL